MTFFKLNNELLCIFFLNFVWIVNYRSGPTFLDLLTPLTPPGCVFIVDWNKTKATSSTVIWFLSVLRIFRSFRSPFFNCSKNPGIFGKWSRVPIMEFRFASGPRHSMIFRLHIVRQKYLKIIVSKANFFLNTYFIFHFLHQLKWFCEANFFNNWNVRYVSFSKLKLPYFREIISSLEYFSSFIKPSQNKNGRKFF